MMMYGDDNVVVSCYMVHSIVWYNCYYNVINRTFCFRFPTELNVSECSAQTFWNLFARDLQEMLQGIKRWHKVFFDYDQSVYTFRVQSINQSIIQSIIQSVILINKQCGEYMQAGLQKGLDNLRRSDFWLEGFFCPLIARGVFRIGIGICPLNFTRSRSSPSFYDFSNKSKILICVIASQGQI